MPNTALQKQLEKLHAQLQSPHAFSEDELEMLEAISRDIEAIEAGHNDSESLIEPIKDQVNETLIHFDQEHPTIFKLLQEISDALGKMGI
ncbi:MAG TPA: DUF4404 family protein [Pseudomonadales bacterium]